MDILRGIGLLITGFLNLFLALFLWFRTKRTPAIFHLGWLAFFSMFYALTFGLVWSFWKIAPHNLLLSLNRATWLGILGLPPFIIFIYYFMGKTKKIKAISYSFYFIAIALVSLSLFTPLMIINIDLNLSPPGIRPEDYGILQIPGRLFIIFCLILGLVNLLKYYFQTTGFKKLQIKYFLLGISVYAIGVLIFAGFLPLFLKKSSYIDIGAYLSFVWVGLTTYAIVKYQLMEIRVFLKKALFYAIIIGLISGLITAVTFLNDWFVHNVPSAQLWTIPFLAGLVAFIIGHLFWQKSQEADKLKYEFIRVAAHNLRTPITHVKWATEELLEMAKTEKERNLVSQINNQNEQLLKLADILLNISQEEYKNSYKLSPVNLEEISREILANFQTQIDAKGLRIIFSVDKNLAKINTDEEKIGAVIQTLLENAIMYTPKEGEIQISIERRKNNLVFSVKDNGMGITKEEQPYIFSRFFRSHRAELIQTEGFGLGLFLVRNIVERLRGKIGFESEGENKGARFWFSLPLS